MEPLTGPVTDPKVLIEGVLFRARYLGSTQVSKNISVFCPYFIQETVVEGCYS